jgi:hypothetical protein
MNLNTILNQIDLQTQDVLKTFGAISSMERGWRPDPSKWSINQHFEHLIVLNESYYPEFDRIQRGERNPVFTSRLPGLPYLFGRMILSSARPQNPRKMKTFSVWQPSITPSDVDVVLEFEQHHSQLKEKLKELEGSLNRSVIISSPANKWIVYTLDVALEIILTHEQRHIQHAKKLLDLISGSE